MIGVENVAALADAGALIGTVLLEAIVLYVGYGVLEQVIGRRMVDRLRHD